MFSCLKQRETTELKTDFNGNSAVCEKKIIPYHHHDFGSRDSAKP